MNLERISVEVSNFSDLKAALTNDNVTDIYLTNDIKLEATIIVQGLLKNIYGNNHMIDATRMEIKLAKAGAIGTIEDLLIINTDIYGLFWSDAQNVKVTYKNVEHHGHQMLYLLHGELTIDGSVISYASNEEVFQGHSLTIAPSAMADFRTEGASPAIRLSNAGGFVNVGTGASLKIASKGIGIESAATVMLTSEGSIEITSQTKQAIHLMSASRMDFKAGSSLKALSGDLVEEALEATNGSIFVRSGARVEIVSKGTQGAIITGESLVFEEGSHFSITNTNEKGAILGAYSHESDVSINSPSGVSTWSRGNVASEVPTKTYNGALTASFTLSGYTNTVKQTNLISNNSDFQVSYLTGATGRLINGDFYQRDITNEYVKRETIISGVYSYDIGAQIKKASTDKIFIQFYANVSPTPDYRLELNLTSGSATSGMVAHKFEYPQRFLTAKITLETPSGAVVKEKYLKIIGENTPPEIRGAYDKEIFQNISFDPLEGVTAWDAENGDLTAELTVTGRVDTSTLGTYELTYGVRDYEGEVTQVKRLITVVAQGGGNTPPVLAGVEDITILLNSEFDILAGVTAWDDEDGDLTDKIMTNGKVDTTTEGVYTVSYLVMDSEGLVAKADRKVTVEKSNIPNTPPMIAGVADKTIEKDSDFDEMKGIIAFDKEDGDITHLVEVFGGPVDTNQLGVTGLIYLVTDSGGLSDQQRCNITVV